MCCTSILSVTHLLVGFHQSGSVSRPDRSGAQSLKEARAAPVEAQAQDTSQDAVAAINSQKCAQCAFVCHAHCLCGAGPVRGGSRLLTVDLLEITHLEIYEWTVQRQSFRGFLEKKKKQKLATHGAG